jgi:hypothetical protein
MGNSAFSFSQSRVNVQAVGTKNGVNTDFTMPFGESYEEDSLEVYLNGQLISPDAITQNGPGFTTFTITDTDILPVSTDLLTVSYAIA